MDLKPNTHITSVVALSPAVFIIDKPLCWFCMASIVQLHAAQWCTTLYQADDYLLNKSLVDFDMTSMYPKEQAIALSQRDEWFQGNYTKIKMRQICTLFLECQTHSWIRSCRTACKEVACRTLKLNEFRMVTFHPNVYKLMCPISRIEIPPIHGAPYLDGKVTFILFGGNIQNKIKLLSNHEYNCWPWPEPMI